MPPEGILTIYKRINVADKGLKPQYELEKLSEHFYEKRTIGITRMYAAKGANSQIDALVRIDPDYEADADMIVILEGGKQYRIDLIQELKNDNGLYVMDLTLVRLEKFYDVAEQIADNS